MRFGLGAIRNVGLAVVEQIRLAREQQGAFVSFHDFLRKVPIQVANKRTVESLIKAGAFDSLGATRRALLEIHEDAVDSAVSLKHNEAQGMVGFDYDSLWDEPEQVVDVVPDRPEWTKRDKLAFEREMLEALRLGPARSRGSRRSWRELPVGHHQRAPRRRRRRRRRDGDGRRAHHRRAAPHRPASRQPHFGSIALEDFTGEITIIALGRTYLGSRRRCRAAHHRGREGPREPPRRRRRLHAQTVTTPELVVRTDTAAPLTITLAEQRATTELVGALADILIRHAGHAEVRLRLGRAESARVFELPYRVQRSSELGGAEVAARPVRDPAGHDGAAATAAAPADRWARVCAVVADYDCPDVAHDRPARPRPRRDRARRRPASPRSGRQPWPSRPPRRSSPTSASYGSSPAGSGRAVRRRATRPPQGAGRGDRRRGRCASTRRCAALEEAIDRVRSATSAQVPPPVVTRLADGMVRQRWQPVRRVGLYVPGGKAVYPSSTSS